MRFIYAAFLFFGIKILSLPFEWATAMGALYLVTFCQILDWDINRRKV